MAVPLWATLALLEFIVLGVFTAWLVRYYASKAAPFYSLSIVFISWYLGFFGTLFLPIDIAEAYASRYTNTTNVTQAGGWVPTVSPSPVPGNWTPGGNGSWAGNVTISTSPLPSPSWLPIPTGNDTGNGTEPGWSLSATPFPLPSPGGGNGTDGASASGSISVTPSASVTPSVTPSVSETASITPSASGTASITPSASGTASITPSASGTPSPSQSPSSTPSLSGTPTGTPVSATPSDTGTPSATPSPTPTGTGSGTPSITPSRSSSPSITPTRTRTPSITPTRTRTPSITPTRTRTPSRTPARASASPSPLPSGADCEGGCSRLLEGEAQEGKGRVLSAAAAEEDGSLSHSLVRGVAGGVEGALGWAARILRTLGLAAPEAPADARSLQQEDASPSPSPAPGGSPASPSADPAPSASPSPGASSSGGEGDGSSTPTPSPSPAASNGTSGGSDAYKWLVASEEMQTRNGPLESMWLLVYWCTAVLTYVIIPIAQEYVAAGEFTKRGRLCASIRINMIFYAAIGMVAFVALAYVIFGLGASLLDLFPVLISVANTSGLLIIVLLLGYGTAEIPRALWRKSDPEGELRKLYFKAAETEGSLFDGKQMLGDIVREVKEFEAKLAQMAADREFSGKPEVSTLQRNMAVVNRKLTFAQELLGKHFEAAANLSSGYRSRIKSRREEEEEAEEDEGDSFFAKMSKLVGGGGSKYKGINPSKLSAIHKRLMATVAKVKKQQFRFDALVLRCLELEYVVAKTVPPVPKKCKTEAGQTFYSIIRGAGLGDATARRPAAFAQRRKVLPGGGVIPPGSLKDNEDVLSEKAAFALTSMMCMPRTCGGCVNAILWRFKIHATPYAYKLIWLLAEVLSLLLLWSEATIWINLQGLVTENLSVFGMLLQAADELGGGSYFAILLASALPLSYMCLCSTFAMFRLKLFDMLDLSGNQNTDPYSLLVNASFFNRLQFSLAFNFLNVCMHSRNKSDFPDTAFLHSVGAKMSLSMLDWYLPLLAVLIYLACKANLFDRFLRKLGYEDKGEPQRGNREHDTAIAEGRIVVQRARATLGLGGDGITEEELEQQAALARDRRALVMMRAEARRQGRNPDEIAPMGYAGDIEMAAMPTGAGAGPGPAAYGSDITPVARGMTLDQFSAKGGTAGGGAGAGGGGGKLSLLALASKATGAGKLSAALGLGGGSSSSAGGKSGVGPGEEGADGSEPYGRVDLGDEDGLPAPAPAAGAGSRPGAGGGSGALASAGAGRPGDRWQQSLDTQPAQPTASWGMGSLVPDVVLEAPPTLAQLLRGPGVKRSGAGAEGPSGSPVRGSPVRGASAGGLGGIGSPGPAGASSRALGGGSVALSAGTPARGAPAADPAFGSGLGLAHAKGFARL